MGWVALAVVAPVAAFAAIAVGRGALGDSAVVDALSPAQVSAALASAGTPAPAPAPTTHVNAGPTTPQPSGHATAPSAKPSLSSRPAGSSRPTSASHSPAPSTSSTAHTPSPSPTHTPSPPPPHTALLTIPGGSVVAQCSGSGYRTVYLVSWSPAQGFRVVDVSRGPGQEAEIEFESDHGSSSATVLCRNGYPVAGYGGGDD